MASSTAVTRWNENISGISLQLPFMALLSLYFPGLEPSFLHPCFPGLSRAPLTLSLPFLECIVLRFYFPTLPSSPSWFIVSLLHSDLLSARYPLERIWKMKRIPNRLVFDYSSSRQPHRSPRVHRSPGVHRPRVGNCWTGVQSLDHKKIVVMGNFKQLLTSCGVTSNVCEMGELF